MKHQKTNATLPRGMEPTVLTMEQALELIVAKKKKPPRKKATKKKATKNKAAKKAAKKKATKRAAAE